MKAMDAEAGRIIRMEPRCPDVEYEDTGAGVRSQPLDAETRMKEYKRLPVPQQVCFCMIVTAFVTKHCHCHCHCHCLGNSSALEQC
jgi:hypothetical protein